MKISIVNKETLHIESIIKINKSQDYSILYNDYPLDKFEYIQCQDDINIRFAKAKYIDSVLTVSNDSTTIEDTSLTLLRIERNKRLDDCGWRIEKAFSTGTQLPVEWINYMQLLRDLPAIASPKLDEKGNLDLASVDWPTKPNT
jgi:hypothetical protein